MQIVKVVDPLPDKWRSACTPVRLGRRQVAYIVADAHLLAPKLQTLAPHDTAATASRNDGWNASGCWIWQASPNRRVQDHEIPTPDAVA
jgi:hypothetical protein